MQATGGGRVAMTDVQGFPLRQSSPRQVYRVPSATRDSRTTVFVNEPTGLVVDRIQKDESLGPERGSHLEESG